MFILELVSPSTHGLPPFDPGSEKLGKLKERQTFACFCGLCLWDFSPIPPPIAAIQTVTVSSSFQPGMVTSNSRVAR